MSTTTSTEAKKPGRPVGWRKATPAYRLHKRSGNAVVTLDGRDHYLGKHGSKDSRDKYDRIVGEWLASGRQAMPNKPANETTINDLVLRYWTYLVKKADEDPRKNAKSRVALRIVRQLYGPTYAEAFDPMAIMAVREHMRSRTCEAGKGISPRSARVMRETGIGDGLHPVGELAVRPRTWSRKYVHEHLKIIVDMFRWGMIYKLVPASVHHSVKEAFKASVSLRDIHENDAVKPVAQETVDATLPFLTPTVQAIVQLQAITGMRSGEVTIMRPKDIDRTNETWFYRPAHHKTEKRGTIREIPLGPRCQEIIRPYLEGRDPERFVFDPREGWDFYNNSRGGEDQAPRKRRRRTSRRKFNPHYSTSVYNGIIHRAAGRADRAAHERQPDVPAEKRIVPHWHPHQLRHLAATRWRKEHGIELAAMLLGHKHLDTTEIYAERHRDELASVMNRVG